MTLFKDRKVVKFVYSAPYEEALLKLAGGRPTLEFFNSGKEKAKLVQEIWDKYEKKILKNFEIIYKIRVSEKLIKIYVSQVAPNSFSDPLTISVRAWKDLENNLKSRRGLIYSIIHELAHYFSYSRGGGTFFNKLLSRVQKENILGDRKANLHFLIQAVEFGIIGEVFGQKLANYRRDWIIKNWADNQYGKSAMLLKELKVPLDKSCLVYIDKLNTNKALNPSG